MNRLKYPPGVLRDIIAKNQKTGRDGFLSTLIIIVGLTLVLLVSGNISAILIFAAGLYFGLRVMLDGFGFRTGLSFVTFTDQFGDKTNRVIKICDITQEEGEIPPLFNRKEQRKLKEERDKFTHTTGGI